MPHSGSWSRVFVGLLLAVVPPIIFMVGALLLTESVFRSADPNVVATLVVLAAVTWTAILAIVYTRMLAEDERSLVALARRGDAVEQGSGSAYEELARALEERNRQVAALARQSGRVPIDKDPRTVAGEVLGTVRDVVGDPTWRLSVLASDAPELLPALTYRAGGDKPQTDRVGDVELWASVTASEAPARYAVGPWGAFTIVDASAPTRFTAILLAPWDGRAAPTPAELNLLHLVGQFASTALEHLLLYARVRSQADELRRLSALQTDFLRGVTHDLQTPLTSIGALATELRADGQLPESARGDLDMIAHQADRLRRMVSQLLVASRLEAGAIMPHQEVFAVGPIIERTWRALRADRPLNLGVEGPPHLAIGDPDRLEQVLWAVLDNAVKYSPPGSSIDVSIRPRSADLEVEVRDHGIGMDSTTRARAFEQFYRSEDARRVVPDGSGVGLYAAKGLMEVMGGSIAAASTLGTGTTVILRIPAEPITAVAD